MFLTFLLRGLLALLLPETLGKELPETIKDGADIGSGDGGRLTLGTRTIRGGPAHGLHVSTTSWAERSLKGKDLEQVAINRSITSVPQAFKTHTKKSNLSPINVKCTFFLKGYDLFVMFGKVQLWSYFNENTWKKVSNLTDSGHSYCKWGLLLA